MVAMLLVLFVAIGNFALGFYLAIHFGHGPARVELPNAEKVRGQLRTLLRLNGKQA
jgi:hypothetical protein